MAIALNSTVVRKKYFTSGLTHTVGAGTDVMVGFVTSQPGAGAGAPVYTMTYNGDGMTGGTSFDSGAGEGWHRGIRSFTLLSPDTGAVSLVASCDRGAGAGGGDSGNGFWGASFSGVHQTTPARAATGNANVTAGSMSTSPTSEVGDVVLCFVSLQGSATITDYGGGTLLGTTYSEDNVLVECVSFAGTAGTTTCALTFSSSQLHAFTAFALIPAASGPTIDTQPVAGTVVLGEAEFASKTFTVAATTSGGSLSYDWELETSVGGGVYANLADGSGTTWTGQTAASCVATSTTTGITGRRVRCNVTDNNGTTTTSAVALTITQGNTLTQPSLTDIAGEFDDGAIAATMALSNFAGQNGGEANGWVQVIVNTVDGIEVARTTVQPKP